MSVKLKVRSVETVPGTVFTTVRGDTVSTAKPDAGEFILRIADRAEANCFEVGKTYLTVEEV